MTTIHIKIELDRTFLKTDKHTIQAPLKQSKENHSKIHQRIKDLSLWNCITCILNISGTILRMSGAFHKSAPFLAISPPRTGLDIFLL